MKKTLLAAILAMSATSAIAANPTAVLKVKGTLTNAACTLTLDNGGVVRRRGSPTLPRLTGSLKAVLGKASLPISAPATPASCCVC